MLTQSLATAELPTSSVLSLHDVVNLYLQGTRLSVLALKRLFLSYATFQCEKINICEVFVVGFNPERPFVTEGGRGPQGNSCISRGSIQSGSPSWYSFAEGIQVLSQFHMITAHRERELINRNTKPRAGTGACATAERSHITTWPLNSCIILLVKK